VELAGDFGIGDGTPAAAEVLFGYLLPTDWTPILPASILTDHIKSLKNTGIPR